MCLCRYIFNTFIAFLLLGQASVYANNNFVDDVQNELPKSFSDFVICKGVMNAKTDIGVNFTIALDSNAQIEDGAQEEYGLVRKAMMDEGLTSEFAWTELVKLQFTRNGNLSSVVATWHLVEAFEGEKDILEIDLVKETGKYTTQFPKKRSFDLNCDHILSQGDK